MVHFDRPYIFGWNGTIFSPMKRSLICIVGWLAMVGVTPGIVVSNYTVAESPPYGDWDLNWDYVYRYRNSSAVAVAPHWLLTAFHVAIHNASSTVTVGGTNYFEQEIVFHLPDFDPDHTNRADIALVRFDKAFPNYYPLYDGAFPTEPADQLPAVIVGFGMTGNVFSNYFTLGSGGYGTKRWGTQTIAEPTNRIYNIVHSSVTNTTHNMGFRMNFNLEDTPYEAGANTGDSGGGVFVKDNGIWKLAGIMTSLYRTNSAANGIFAVSVPDYLNWIEAVVTPTADLDGDGIPNYWEVLHGGSVTSLVASADMDGDGFTNLQEYIADTDPNDDEDFLYVSAVAVDDEHTLYFNGSTARVYQAWFTTNSLTDTPLIWEPLLATNMWGAGTNTFITITNAPPSGFYRLQVELP